MGLAALLDALGDLTCWLDKEDMLNAHIVGIHFVWFCILEVLVEVHHLLASFIKLYLIVAVQELTCISEVVDVVLKLVELLFHKVSVKTVRVTDLSKALLNFLLFFDLLKTFVLKVLNVFLHHLVLASLS